MTALSTGTVLLICLLLFKPATVYKLKLVAQMLLYNISTYTDNRTFKYNKTTLTGGFFVFGVCPHNILILFQACVLAIVLTIVILEF